MDIVFSYMEENLPINSVSLLLHDLSGQIQTFQMLFTDSVWQYKAPLSPGEYLYKFLINEDILLCDPYNNLFDLDANQDVWSLLIIDDEENLCINPSRFHVTVSNYMLSPNEPANNLGAYKDLASDKISATITCKEITGVHVLTAAWYKPDEILYEYSENPLCADPQSDDVSTMFWIENNETVQEFPGLWTFRLFLDGKLLLTDKFSILGCSSFSNYG